MLYLIFEFNVNDCRTDDETWVTSLFFDENNAFSDNVSKDNIALVLSQNLDIYLMDRDV